MQDFEVRGVHGCGSGELESVVEDISRAYKKTLLVLVKSPCLMLFRVLCSEIRDIRVLISVDISY